MFLFTHDYGLKRLLFCISCVKLSRVELDTVWHELAWAIKQSRCSMFSLAALQESLTPLCHATQCQRNLPNACIKLNGSNSDNIDNIFVIGGGPLGLLRWLTLTRHCLQAGHVVLCITTCPRSKSVPGLGGRHTAMPTAHTPLKLEPPELQGAEAERSAVEIVSLYYCIESI